jgi:hypothetical protein
MKLLRTNTNFATPAITLSTLTDDVYFAKAAKAIPFLKPNIDFDQTMLLIYASSTSPPRLVVGTLFDRDQTTTGTDGPSVTKIYFGQIMVIQSFPMSMPFVISDGLPPDPARSFAVPCGNAGFVSTSTMAQPKTYAVGLAANTHTHKKGV